MRVRFWNDERRAELKRLWRNRSWSREAIAAHFGISARAVCAERKRLKLKPRPRGQRAKAAPRPVKVRAVVRVPTIKPQPAPVAVALAWPPSRDRLMAGR
jgi:hypothetical protein